LSIFFASELRAVVIGVDYRLAPEYQFPAPLNDCFEALNWTVDHAAEYKINPDRIGLWGGSAGGNLAAALALKDSNEHEISRIRHANLVVPATCHPDLYPAILKTSTASMQVFPFVANNVEANLAGVRALWGMCEIMFGSTSTNEK
jgi:acetyl esterase/lipase